MSEDLKGKIEAPAEVKGTVEPTAEIHVEIAGKGPRGKEGKSAYSYAKDCGYEGTEEEFAEKLACKIEAIPEETLKEILRG